MTRVILFVADQQRAATFYAAVLGERASLDVPGMTEFPLPGGAILGLMPESGVSRLLPAVDPTPVNGNRSELYLTVSDPEAFVERALDAGGSLASAMAPRNWGDRAAYVRDLDGHLVVFAATA